METGRRTRRMVVPGYIKVKKLGNGSQARVFEMARRNNRENDITGAERFAVKIFFGERAQRSLQTELHLLTTLQGHGNIVRMVEHFDTPDLSALVLEICETDLFALHSRSDFSQNDFVRVTRGVLSGLEHMHKHKIVHRDVKPENIAIVADGSARLIDFGIAVSLLDTDGIRKRRGSLEYLAPEVFNKDLYGLEIDMFAFGVTCYYVLSKQHPLAIPEITYELAAEQSRRYSLSFGSSFNDVSKDTIDLISWLMHPCEAWRPDASFALTCPPYAPCSLGETNDAVPSFESQLQLRGVEMHPPPPPQQIYALPKTTMLGTGDDADVRCEGPFSNVATAEALLVVKAGDVDDSQARKPCKLERAIYSAQLADTCHATSFFLHARRKMLDEVRTSSILDAMPRVAPESIIH
eukprot:TRINITY_DN4016_c0_g1_i10.p1 TRINITY_DN4016_c0_g1~~TRINITY_DN4016_c0_g1_i10.p1  ORF type:complete len:408 (+),score=55.98 TRINITY_DN4016_c0_g1_i10:120-1343(+)